MFDKTKNLARRSASLFLITLTIVAWAATSNVAARLRFKFQQTPGDITRIFGGGDTNARPASASAQRVPRPARFRYQSGRGLVVRTWVNDAGPFDFAVDTGAGYTILSQRVAQAARISIRSGRTVSLGGLSNAAPVATQEGSVRSIAIGDRTNILPSGGAVVVTNRLPEDVDGVLDPTASFWPLGYVIDMPRGEISAFDPELQPLHSGSGPRGGATVPWLFDSARSRPFVMIDGGRRALIDTGSGFGLGLTVSAARSLGVIAGRGASGESAHDIAGGQISSQRIAPATVRIGPLELRRVPTQILSGVESGAPIILGREALKPFRLTFDPVNRLIVFAPEGPGAD